MARPVPDGSFCSCGVAGDGLPGMARALFRNPGNGRWNPDRRPAAAPCNRAGPRVSPTPVRTATTGLNGSPVSSDLRSAVPVGGPPRCTSCPASTNLLDLCLYRQAQHNRSTSAGVRHPRMPVFLESKSFHGLLDNGRRPSRAPPSRGVARPGPPGFRITRQFRETLRCLRAEQVAPRKLLPQAAQRELRNEPVACPDLPPARGAPHT